MIFTVTRVGLSVVALWPEAFAVMMMLAYISTPRALEGGIDPTRPNYAPWVIGIVGVSAFAAGVLEVWRRSKRLSPEEASTRAQVEFARWSAAFWACGAGVTWAAHLVFGNWAPIPVIASPFLILFLGPPAKTKARYAFYFLIWLSGVPLALIAIG
jgi:hypothetical protein